MRRFNYNFRSNPRIFLRLERFYSAASVSHLAPNVQAYILEKAELCQPDEIVVCDGSAEENSRLIQTLIDQKQLKPIPKMENCYLAKTDPKDVARVESKTVICTENERETIPIPKPGVEGKILILYHAIFNMVHVTWGGTVIITILANMYVSVIAWYTEKYLIIAKYIVNSKCVGVVRKFLFTIFLQFFVVLNSQGLYLRESQGHFWSGPDHHFQPPIPLPKSRFIRKLI